VGILLEKMMICSECWRDVRLPEPKEQEPEEEFIPEDEEDITLTRRHMTIDFGEE